MGTKKGYLIAIFVWSLGACLHAGCGWAAMEIEGYSSVAQLGQLTGDAAVAIATVSMYLFLSCRMVLALGEAGNFPAAIKVTAEYFPKKDRAFATSIFNSGASVGALAAPATIPLLARAWGWELAFIIIGVLGFLWMGLWMWLYEKPHKNNYVNQFFGEGTQVEAFITDTLRFIFPVENHKRVPVEVSHAVDCRSQFMPSGPFAVTPDSVTVYGEADRLETIEKVTAPHLSLSDVHESQHGVLRLNAISGVRMSAEEVSYSLPVTRYVELRTTVPLEVRNAPAGHHLQVYPPQAEVVLRCAFPIARDPLPLFKLYIDWNDFSSSLTGRCAPRSQRLPGGVLEYRVSPEVFDCIELR
jgi:hypothetical protein